MASIQISDCEFFFRAVRPWTKFIKKDGTFSPTAFLDPNGLSVDRAGKREDSKVVADMRARKFEGPIVSVSKAVCDECHIEVKPAPEKNIYHCLLLDSQREDEKNLILTQEQAVILSRRCKKIAE